MQCLESKKLMKRHKQMATECEQSVVTNLTIKPPLNCKKNETFICHTVQGPILPQLSKILQAELSFGSQ